MTNGRRLQLGASGEDRISKLPRGLITRILNRLNIHEVARTSVLSKTWRKFWPTHPYLILSKRFYLEITCNKKESTHISEFHKVFNMILSAHTGPINMFVLYVSPMLSRCFNHKWIEKLSEKGLRDLYLAFEKMENNEIYVLPSTLFGCRDLIQLRLLNSVIGGPSGMPGRSSFTNLTSVQLYVTTITLDMTFGTQLQSLYLQSCSGIEHLAPQFTSGNNLQKLYIYDCTKIEWQWFQCTTKLVILGLTLTAANSNMKKKVNKLIKLLSKIPTFSSLVLNGPALEVFGPPPSDLTRTITKVRVLKLLRLTLYNLCQMSNVGYLIRSFPNLQYLTIQLELDQVETLNATELTTERYLGSLDGKDMFLDQLQIVNIKGVEDSSYVLPFIKHLLACSPSLKVISLFCTKINDPKEKLRVKQELQQLPRLSLNARVNCLMRPVDINPNDEWINMVMAGITPQILMKSAYRSVMFYIGQKELEMQFKMNMIVAQCRQKCEAMQEKFTEKLEQVHTAYQKMAKKCQMMEQEMESLSKDKQELQENFSEKSRQKRKLDEMYDQLRCEYESMKRTAIQPVNNFYSGTESDLFASPANMIPNRDPLRKDWRYTPDTPGPREDIWP